MKDDASTQTSTETVSVPPQRDRRVLRRVLMLFLPAVVVLGGIAVYAFTGRYVSTDDAYIKADIASVGADASGQVEQVLVADNQAVTRGQPLVLIDSSTARLGLAGAEASLQTAASNIAADKAQYRQKQAELKSAQAESAFATREYERQSQLARSSAAAAAKLDAARRDLDLAAARITLIQEEMAEILARLQGDVDILVERHPGYRMALTQKAMAERMLNNATIRAPFDGIVSQLPKVGDYARAGAPLLSVVSVDAVWVEANFKETDLTHMKAGEPVEVRVDTYPGRVWRGHVESISQATGAEFALLPAQNSSGNWVKVVQRVPVRIAIEEANANGALRSGMSVLAEVDTGHNRASAWFGAAAQEP